MKRYKVRIPAALTFEVEAPTELAARGAIFGAFAMSKPYDPLAGTRFAFESHEKSGARNPRLMTTIANVGSVHQIAEAEEID